MAVKVSVYGTANMKQIENARAELDRLEAQANQSAGGFSGAMTKMGSSITDAGKSMTSAGDTMTKNLTLPLAAAGAGLYKAGEAAAEDAKEQVVLAGVLKNTAGATAAQVKSTEDWITAQGKALGVTDSQLRPALATLATATHDVTKAQQLASMAMDISAAKGIPVETAAKAIAKAYAGQGTAIKKLLPGIDEAALKSKNFGDIQNAINGIVGGAAAKAADTEAGARQRANVQLSEAIESLGYAFLPIMKQMTDILANQVVPAITKLADWFGGLSDGTKKAIVGIGLFIAVVGPTLSIVGRLTEGIGLLFTNMSKLPQVFGVVKTAAISLWETMMANPFIAIAAVVAIVAVLIITHWDQVKAALSATWNWISNTATTIWTAVKEFFVGTLNSIHNKFDAVWDGIKTAFSAAINFISNLALNWTIAGQIIKHWDAIKDGAQSALGAVIGFFKSVPGRILDALGDFGSMLNDVGVQIVRGLWEGISSAGSWLYNQITSWGHSILNSIKSVFGVHSPSVEMAKIGGFMGEGLALGLADSIGTVAATAAQLGRSTLDAISGTLTPTIGINANGFGGVPSLAGANANGGRSIVIQTGAVQVSVSGNASPSDTRDAVAQAFDDLVRALGAK